MAKRPVKKTSENQVEKVNNQASLAPKTPTQKKKHHKLTRAEYDDLRQIDWVPFDPYAD